MKSNLLPTFFLVASCAAAVGQVDYAREILPILSERCFQCHGPDENTREAGLRLDTHEGATASSEEHGLAIIAGDPDGSELVRRILSKDPDVMMPPPAQHKQVSEAQAALLKQWIKEGAPYSKHWAFVAPVKQQLPLTATHPIDEFVKTALKKQGQSLSPAAPPEVLVRRLHLDVIGLPPSPAEIDGFVAEYHADPRSAVAKRVDQLLGSEHFGEKWARHWLDIARYSDTNGFEKDLPREQWSYRDWVIDAINRDMPYDKFLIEQIAGDMLPDRTQEQVVASGFLRNGMVNEEGAIIPEQFRTEGKFDEMDTIGRAAVGLSLQCARCHTHKFDPITHDEYFGMFAFLNDTYETESWVYSPEQKALLERLQGEVRALEGELKSSRPAWQDDLARWQTAEREKSVKWTVLDTDKQLLDGGLNHPVELADHSALILGHRTNFGLLYFEAEPNLTAVTGLRLEALRHLDLPFGGPGRGPDGGFAISEIGIDIQVPGSTDWKPVKTVNASADFIAPERLFKDVYSLSPVRDKDVVRKLGPVSFLNDENELLGWYPDRGPVIRHTDSAAVLQFAEPLDMPPGTRMKIRLIQVHGGGKDGLESNQLGRVRFALTQDAAPVSSTYNFAATLAMDKSMETRTPEDEAALFRAWRLQLGEAASINQKIAALEKQYPEAATSVLNIEARPPADQRVTHLLDRGEWNLAKHEVKPHVMAALHPMTSETATRLDFARWLASRDSPLAARVQVNRVWQAVFGSGFVMTPEDFGVRAPRPEYLELFDWLSVDFMDGKWSLKALLKTVLTSETYQQDSRVTPELLENDPANRLLARGPRFRLEAEVLRDLALSVGGLIHHREGGPGVYPPVPQSVIDNNFVKPEYWIAAEAPERYRRSIYLFRKRSMPDPVLTTFDAPYGDFSCSLRLRSNSPLAALTSLNETVFVEAARGLAARVLREAGSSEQERIDYAYRLCTGRTATTAEAETVKNFIQQQLARFDSGTLVPDEILGSAAPAGTEPKMAAAWVITARVLINLDETLNKN